MKIVIVSTFYSKGMGYTENCLPRAFAKMGHDVHVVTSNFNIYGNDDDYRENYQSFLGSADQGTGTFECDGYTVHRLPSRTIANYVQIIGLAGKIKSLNPDIVHSVAIASVQTYLLAIIKPFSRFKLFTETHQHLSVVKPFLRSNAFHPVKRSLYWLTRTLPIKLTSLFVEKCYAVAPDCLDVAKDFFGVPQDKLELQSLGSDTSLFAPANNDAGKLERALLRQKIGYAEDDLVCVYTGRFTEGKNPLLLARAIDELSRSDRKWHGLFVGEGGQREVILACQNTKIIPFMTHSQLSKVYAAADIAVWPRQESMSMLDASASGLPLVASDQMGESERVQGSGVSYKENDVKSLIQALLELSVPEVRNTLGAAGREKICSKFSWNLIAERFEYDYKMALSKK
jgi:glycosyltransferase involved in cell wall biosynthesis